MSETNPVTLLWTRPDGSTRRGPKDDIMAAYWKAGQKGTICDASAPAASEAPAVLASKDPAKVKAWAQQRGIAVYAGIDGISVDAGKAKTIAAQEAAMRAQGWSLPRAHYAAGTRLLQMGVNAYKAKHRQWAKRPDAVDAMEEVAAHIESEQRSDFVVRLGDLHMDADGCLGRKGGPARQIEWTAWDRVYGALQGVGVLPDGFKLLRELTPTTRAAVFNERIQAMNPDKEVKLGLRKGANDQWSIFRVVSPRYPTDGQAPVILRALAKQLRGKDFRGEVIYDPGTTSVRFNMAHMADPVELDPAVGDVFRAGVKGSTNDAGMGRFRITPFAGRIVCINCTVMDGYAPGYSRIHRGSMAEAMQAASEVAQKAVDVLPVFAADWSRARQTSVADVEWRKLGVGKKAAAEARESVPGALEAMVRAGQIGSGTHRDALVQHMLNAHKVERGTGTVADLLNAVTRAAHESMMADIQRDLLERQAGALLPMLVKAAEA